MITRFNRDELAKNLPDAYLKSNGSNNAKILAIEHGASSDLRAALREIEDSLDISKAYGKTLDMYGEMIGQMRGIATDEQYRVLIKNKLLRNIANADFNSVVNAICMTFDCDPHDVLLVENDETCVVSLEGLPLDKLTASNIDINTAIAIINSLLPVSVHMEAISFDGTFEFADVEMLYDEDKGFADDAHTIGGTLGLLANSTGGKLPV